MKRIGLKVLEISKGSISFIDNKDDANKLGKGVNSHFTVVRLMTNRKKHNLKW